jgi:hypothetical protein
VILRGDRRGVTYSLERYDQILLHVDSLNDKGDLRLKVSFEGEAAGTYRIYDYVADEYDMRSFQYDQNAKETGLFYGGRFTRRQTTSARSFLFS